MPKRSIHKSITEDRVLAACMRRMNTLDNPGFCLACGEDADGCEPDARNCVCEICDAPAVWGSDEMLIAGLYHPDKVVKRDDA